MIIKSRQRDFKIEYTRRRNKCPCCTRFNCREEILRRVEIKEAMKEIGNE